MTLVPHAGAGAAVGADGVGRARGGPAIWLQADTAVSTRWRRGTSRTRRRAEARFSPRRRFGGGCGLRSWRADPRHDHRGGARAGRAVRRGRHVGAGGRYDGIQRRRRTPSCWTSSCQPSTTGAPMSSAARPGVGLASWRSSGSAWVKGGRGLHDRGEDPVGEKAPPFMPRTTWDEGLEMARWPRSSLPRGDACARVGVPGHDVVGGGSRGRSGTTRRSTDVCAGRRRSGRQRVVLEAGYALAV